MTDAEYRRAALQAAWLSACAVKGTVPDAERIAGMNPEQVYEAAAFHQLAAAAGMALEAAGVRNPLFLRAVADAQRRTLLMNRDRQRILAALEAEGIRYMPLKGAVLQELYPRFAMREMSDNDILFDAERAADVRRIMERLGFTADSFGSGPHDEYSREPVSHFEMHRRLFSYVPRPGVAAYFGDVWPRLVREPGTGFGYRFADVDFYLYMIAHMFRHYEEKGTGLRSLLDIYVFLRNRMPDPGPAAAKAEEIGIGDFERTARELALHVFEEEPPGAEQERMLDRILAGGTYGLLTEEVGRQVAEKGRLRYFLSRLTMPYGKMLEEFPALRKAPALYPVFWAWRLVRGVLLRREKARYQLRAALGLTRLRRKQGEPEGKEHGEHQDHRGDP